MSVTTTYKSKKIDNDVNKFVEYIKKNKIYFNIVCDALTITKRHGGKVQGSNYTEEEIKIINDYFFDKELEGEISEEEAEELKELYIKIGIDGSGDALEELIALLGPYDRSDYETPIYTRDGKIFEAGSDKNFDVIFCEKNKKKYSNGCRIIINSLGEFYECKRNIANVIPYNIEDEKCDILDKLDFIHDVYTLHKDGKYYIPTYYSNIESHQEFLNNAYNGKYKFITILGKNELIKLYSE